MTLAHWLLALIIILSAGLGAAVTAVAYVRQVRHLHTIIEDLERALWREAKTRYRRTP